MSAELKIIQSMIDRFSKSSAGSASVATETAQRAVGIHGTLAGIQASIAKKAEQEQRNGAWLKENVNMAFAAKYAEIARLRHQNDKARKNHERTKPMLPAFDRTDVFAALQTMELAKRVAATTDPAKRANLSTTEKLAALRMPELSGLMPSQAAAWTNELLKQTEPEKMKAYTESAEVLAETGRALDLLRLAFQREAGFINRDTGFPSPMWDQFERQQMKILAPEFEALQ
jgi:hypothetical protein